jgi:hypothetical protein
MILPCIVMTGHQHTRILCLLCIYFYTNLLLASIWLSLLFLW